MQTNTVMMVPPVSFGFNDETGLDNEFQHRPDVDEEVIEGKALGEFDDAAASLRVAGVNVLELEPSGDGLETPDAIFPNNWFVTDGDGRIWIYTMKTENRRWEIRPEDAADLLGRKGYKVTAIEKVSEDPEQILEGTGAIVFDHEHRLAYAALSERCQESLLRSHCERIGYRPVAFTTQSSKGQPIYHTNVVMSVGKDFVVACVESIVEADRQGFLDALEASGKKLMDISFAQMEQHFLWQHSGAGNRRRQTTAGAVCSGLERL